MPAEMVAEIERRKADDESASQWVRDAIKYRFVLEDKGEWPGRPDPDGLRADA